MVSVGMMALRATCFQRTQFARRALGTRDGDEGLRQHLVDVAHQDLRQRRGDRDGERQDGQDQPLDRAG